ncbi:hypothetical protein MNV49_002096 [Pseudohyphozyma bogoriensis]|nr:hypothetical protein MNV49_002096 [Pseudohyphozyma bogoriensis]
MASFGGKRGCFKCGELNHIAENCSSPSRLCYNCHEAGHESSQCPNPRTSDSKQCFCCGGVGHIQAECPTLRLGGPIGGPQTCYACGKPGHIARACPTATGGATLDGELAPVAGGAVPVARPVFAGRGGFGGFRGGFRGGFPGRGGFVAGGGKVCTAAGPVAGVAGVRPPKTCYKCQEPGHLARECPLLETTA